MSERFYILWDERAIMEGTDKTTALDTCSNLQEAKEISRSLEYNHCCASYNDSAGKLEDERGEYVYYETACPEANIKRGFAFFDWT